MLALSTVGVVLSVAWWWPGIMGRDRQIDVLIVPSRTALLAQEEIDRRLREEGFTTSWVSVPSEECAIAPIDSQSVRSLPFERIVVFLPNSVQCGQSRVRSALDVVSQGVDGNDLVGVIAWDESPTTSAPPNIRFVDPRPLIGNPGELQDCLWWDDCPPEGRIVTIEGDVLTKAGRQRLARVVVAGVL